MERAIPFTFRTVAERREYLGLVDAHLTEMRARGVAFTVAPFCAIPLRDGRVLRGGDLVSLSDFGNEPELLARLVTDGHVLAVGAEA